MKKLITILLILFAGQAYSQIYIAAPSIIEDTEHRFVTDKDKNNWNSKSTGTGGGISYIFAPPLYSVNGNISIPAASVTSDGYLSRDYFNLFNSKPDVAAVMKMITDNIVPGTGGGGNLKDSFLLPIGPGLTYKNNVLDVASYSSSSPSFKSVTVTSAAYTVADGIATVYCNYGGGSLALRLPPPAQNIDRRITVKNYSSKNVIITPVHAGDLFIQAPFDAWTFQADASNWNLIMK